LGYIDLEYFRSTLSALRNDDTDPSRGGNPRYDEVLRFKILNLQRCYIIRRASFKCAILDRLSFMRFLGLSLNDRVPELAADEEADQGEPEVVESAGTYRVHICFHGELDEWHVPAVSESGSCVNGDWADECDLQPVPNGAVGCDLA